MNSNPATLVLQYRWKRIEVDSAPHLLYYGVRNPPAHRDILLPMSRELAELLDRSNGEPFDPPASLRAELADLVATAVLVPPAARRDPVDPETMQQCSRCVTNNYVIPGLEFDDEGICALCQCYAQTKAPARSAFATVSEEELIAATESNRRSRVDVMVLYTGGKDSSYMLWLLARKLKLRVLAAFWNMPYCTPAAYENIRRARETMPEVEFVEWSLPLDTVRQAMRAKWHSHGWPCLCPTAAFPLLYPLAVQMRIPYVFLGLEDVQASVLDYVVAQPAADPAAAEASARDLALDFLAARALPRPQKTPLCWPDEMSNYHAAVRDAMPEVFEELAAFIEEARKNPERHVPLIGRLSTNEAYGSWQDAKQIIESEMDWRAPVGQSSLLHTSCSLEPVKDYLQFQRFQAMRTVFMPQSLVELGAAVHFGLVSRADALQAVDELGYWQPPSILDQLTDDLGISKAGIAGADDELPSGLREWAAQTA